TKLSTATHQKEGFTVVRVTDRLYKTFDLGYRDILINVVCRGFVGEIQLTLDALWDYRLVARRNVALDTLPVPVEKRKEAGAVFVACYRCFDVLFVKSDRALRSSDSMSRLLSNRNKKITDEEAEETSLSLTHTNSWPFSLS